MRIKNIKYPRPNMDHMMVKAGSGFMRFVIGQETDLDPASGVAIMAKWKGCFELVPDPVEEKPKPRAVPRKAIPTASKQIRTAPKDK